MLPRSRNGGGWKFKTRSTSIGRRAAKSAPDPDHPHGRGDDLGQLIQRQAKALQAFFRDFTVRAVLAEMGELGRIRAFEVTHGRKGTNNGWHPHYHFLQFCQVKADAAQLMDWRTRLYLRWDACCQRAGLGSPSFAHGIDLQDGRKADRYISKWGLEDELTRAATRRRAGRAVRRRLTCCAPSWPTRKTGRRRRFSGVLAVLQGQAAIVLVKRA